VKIITPSSTHNQYLLGDQEEKTALRKHQENKQRLRVPRRPAWTKDMPIAQLERREKDAFLEWRRGLAQYVTSQITRPLLSYPTILTDYKKRNFYLRPLNETLRSGASFGESWSDRIS